MSDNLKQFAELLKDGRKKSSEPSQSPDVVVSPTDDLKSLLLEMKAEKRKQKDELRTKATTVLPKLGDFFGALTSSKTALDAVHEEVIDSTQSIVPEVVVQAEIVADVIESVETAIEDVTENSAMHITEEDLNRIRKSISALETRLTKEVQTLKTLIQSQTKTVVTHSTSGGGEVMFSRLDDIKLSGLTDGDLIAWDNSQKKFINIRPPTTTQSGISGGAANQVLVKKSGADFDYEWQDMIVSQQEYTKLIDDTSSQNVTYIGEAFPSTAPTTPEWRIKKISFDSSGNVDSVMYAGSGNFEHAWINRIIVGYS